MLISLTEIDAEVKDVDDSTAMELRLIENCHREDLTNAEKGDAVLTMLESEKYETIKDIADAIKIPYQTVLSWTNASNRLSDSVKKYVRANTLTERAAYGLLKYPHSVQDKLAKAIIGSLRKTPM